MYVLWICIIDSKELYQLGQQCFSGKISLHFLLIVSKNFLQLQAADDKTHNGRQGLGSVCLFVCLSVLLCTYHVYIQSGIVLLLGCIVLLVYILIYKIYIFTKSSISQLKPFPLSSCSSPMESTLKHARETVRNCTQENM